MTPLETLTRIRDRLDAGVAPVAVIEEMLPQTREGAVTWAGRLPGWAEYHFPDHVTATARLISRRAMKEHGLALSEDGRVVERPHEGRRNAPSAARAFLLMDGQVRAEYAPGYFRDKDHFQFKSPHDPAQPMPLSQTGWWSHFANRDAVEACGGPEGYGKLYAEAKASGREEEFEAAFEGRPEEKRKAAKKGRQMANVVTERADTEVNESLPNDPPPGRLF
jgi:hypothetical protein